MRLPLQIQMVYNGSNMLTISAKTNKYNHQRTHKKREIIVKINLPF